jgi:hypothetical protein
MNAASSRHHAAPGRSSLWTATENGDHIQPITAPSNTRPGPISGAIQYSIAIRYPAPNHQPRATASLVVAARVNSTIPGTSANHAR